MLNLIEAAKAQVNEGMLAVHPITANITPGRLILNVLFWFFTFVGGLAVIYLIYGGLLYITAGGDSEKATKGRTAIQNAVIGLIVIGLSFAILTWVNSALSAAGGGTNAQTQTNGGQAPNFNNPNFQSWLNSQGANPANMSNSELGQAYQAWQQATGGTSNNGAYNSNTNGSNNNSWFNNIFSGNNNSNNGYNTDSYGSGSGSSTWTNQAPSGGYSDMFYGGNSDTGTLIPTQDPACDPYDTGYQYSNCYDPSWTGDSSGSSNPATEAIPI